MRVVGIDLAGNEKRQTGFCVLDGMKAFTSIVYTDEEIIRRIEEIKPEIVAIDAPLSLPKGRKSIDEKSSIHLRECDRELLKMGIKFFPITLGPMRELTKRGIKLKETLKNKGFRVIEVYPGGAQDVLGIPRKQKGLGKLRKGLEKLKIEGLKSNMNDHELDAVTSAFVGKLFLDGKARILGTLGEEIVMPSLNLKNPILM
jgi:predicted nuclease with RNAse H fold